MVYRFSVLLALPFFLGCGPTLLFPGGELGGSSSPTPSDWAWTDEVSTIQLETRPEDPYSVNIWVVGIHDKLYVHAGANHSTWIENLEADSSVRVQVDEKIYALSAFRVEDQAEFDAFADAYEIKYGTRPRNEIVDEVYLFYLKAG